MLGLTAENLKDMKVGDRGADILRNAIVSDIKNLSRGGACSSYDPREWNEKDVMIWVTK